MKVKRAITLFVYMVFIFLSTDRVQHSIATNVSFGQNFKSEYKEVFIASGAVLIPALKNDNFKEYKKITLSNATIYYKDIKELENVSGEGCIIKNKKRTPFMGEKKSCFSYNKNDGTILEIKNITGDEYLKTKRGDLYYNGKLLVKGFPFGCRDKCSYPIYDKKRNIIYGEERNDKETNIIYGEEGDNKENNGLLLITCNRFKSQREFHLTTQKLYVYTIEIDICSARDEYTHYFEKGTGMDIQKLNGIHIPYDSTFSFFKQRYNPYSKYQINCIYSSGKTLKIKDNFPYTGNIITLLIGNKEFTINFDAIEQSKQYMNLLTKKNFHYAIYLTKSGKKHTLHFTKIGNKNINIPETVKSIGIISCKSNYSPVYDTQEYKLKKDKNGNFTYNISEQLNNKCNIPYKINVYYTDGSKETGEYYILFDY